MTKALYTGSFDPVTNGHLDVINRASKMFDEMVVGVILNPQKHCMFTLEERVAMIEELTGDLPNVKVESFAGLLADYANKNEFDVVVRGLRATSDFEYEIQMAQMNAHLFREGTDSVFLMTSPKYSFISSTMIKEVVSLGGSVKGLVPECIEERMKKRFAELKKTK